MSHDAKQDEYECQVGGKIVDKIDKAIYQKLPQSNSNGKGSGKTKSKIATLSKELMISHFKSQDILCQAIKNFGKKRGDNIQIINKNKESGNGSIIEIIPNTTNINEQQVYVKYHLSIYCNNNDDEQDSKDDTDETASNDSDGDESDDEESDDEYCDLNSG